jgi:hypothetical protein
LPSAHNLQSVSLSLPVLGKHLPDMHPKQTLDCMRSAGTGERQTKQTVEAWPGIASCNSCTRLTMRIREENVYLFCLTSIS